MKIGKIIYVLCTISSISRADTVDDLFKGQRDTPANVRTSVDSAVYQLSTEAQSKAYTRAIENENARAEAARQAALDVPKSANSISSSDSDNTAATSGWKVVDTYQGGFADFGMHTPYPRVTVIMCPTGYKGRVYYRDGSWHKMGGFAGGGYDSMQEAGDAECN